MCPNSEGCPMYEQFKMKLLLNFWRSLYCDSNMEYPNCRRFQLKRDGRPVPATMLPNGDDLSA